MSNGFTGRIKVLALVVCFLLAVFGIGVSLLQLADGSFALCLKSFFPMEKGYDEWIPGQLYVMQAHESWLEGVFYDVFLSQFWLFMAVAIAAAGRHRWRSWIQAMSWTCLFLWFLLPIVYCYFPGLAHSSMVDMCWLMFLIYVMSIGFYYVVVPFLWPKMLEVPEGAVGIDAVSPAKGRTIKQISEHGIDYNPRKFLFGKADEELVAHWGMVGKAIIALSRTRRRRASSCVASLLLWPLLIITVSGASQGIYERNVEAMWETVNLPDGTPVATVPAYEAAKRVFKDDLALRGLTRDEARKLLRFDLMNPGYKLNKPRFSWEAGRMFLRISTGKRSAILQVATNDEGRIVVSLVEDVQDSPESIEEMMATPAEHAGKE